MAKSLLLPVLLLLVGQVFSQNMDSLAMAKRVDSLIQVSRGLTGKGEFEKALEVNRAAEKMALEKFGRESAMYGSVCFDRGRVLDLKGDLAMSEKWYLEAVSIRGKVLGTDHLECAKALHNLSIVYKNMGNYEKSEQLALQSKSIFEKRLGKVHPIYAASLLNLANHYLYTGNYEAAEPLYLEAKGIMEKAVGKDKPDYAKSLNNLAILYVNMGNHAQAEPLYLEAKSIWEKTLGKEDPEYAKALINLATLYRDRGNNEKSEEYYLEAKVILEKTIGKGSPDYAQILYNLAGLYHSMGKYGEAEPLYLDTKAILGKSLGIEHPNYAASLNSLASLYQAIGNYEKAEQICIEALTIQKKSFGVEHQDYILSISNLASLLLITGRYTQAAARYNEISVIQQNRLVKALHHLSEQELNIYTNLLLPENQDHVLSLAQSPAAQNPLTSCTAYSSALFHKGFLLNAAARINNPTLRDSATTETFYRLKSYHRRLAAEYAKPIAERKGVEELETKANDLEKELARTVAGYGEAMRQVKWQEVQAALKPGEAAIEFVHYRFWDKKPTDSLMYAALVLMPEGQPKFVPLFEEKQLNTLLHRGGAASPEFFFKNLYEFSGTGKDLNRLIWQPIANIFSAGGGQPKVVYFSPSGLLHRLNLAALPVSESERLGDRFKLIELGSTRQIVVNAPNRYDGASAALFGGVYYDLDTTSATTGPRAKLGGLRGGLSFAHTDSTLRGGGEWKFLPGSEKEITELDKIMSTNGLKTKVFRSAAATEEAFKNTESSPKGNSASPRILHISTHGYFFPDPKTTADHSRPTFDDKQPTFKISEHPMLRSGLILAGGNHAWKTGKPFKEGMEDGILTAYEISQMNLSNTELVVLSACETGLGDIQGNEGVYGLQRAFKIAGAKYLIMSLWQVDDKQTSRLMTLFYKKWLTEKMPIPEALRAAQGELRERGFDPFYWAGFVLVE